MSVWIDFFWGWVGENHPDDPGPAPADSGDPNDLEYLKRLAEKSRGRWEPWFRLGWHALALHNFRTAEKAFRSTILRNRKNALAWHGWGKAMYDGRERVSRSAIYAFEKAIELRPDSRGPLAQLSRIYYGLGRYADAIRMFKSLLRLEPDDVEHYFRIGCCYTALGSHREAVRTAGHCRFTLH